MLTLRNWSVWRLETDLFKLVGEVIEGQGVSWRPDDCGYSIMTSPIVGVTDDVVDTEDGESFWLLGPSLHPLTEKLLHLSEKDKKSTPLLLQIFDVHKRNLKNA